MRVGTDFFKVGAILLLLFLCQCAHRKSQDLNLKQHDYRAFLYGYVRIIRNNSTDITKNAVVTFSDKNKLQLDDAGFIAISVQPNQKIRLEEVVARSVKNVEKAHYGFSNLVLKSAGPDTKTYFGHITIYVTSTTPDAEEDSSLPLSDEKWDWQVENRVSEAQARWHNFFGNSSFKSFLGLAKKAGRNTVLASHVSSRPASQSGATNISSGQSKIIPVKLGY